MDAETPVFAIAVAAELAGMHPQTLRQYDRMGLVSPSRQRGKQRRYSKHDVELLREVQRLSQEEGVNLAGIKRIIELEQWAADLQQRVAELEHALEEAHRLIAHAGAAASFPGREVERRTTTQRAIVVWRQTGR
jgi:MerR family transcriptional regulator/heat shock protein HspR